MFGVSWGCTRLQASDLFRLLKNDEIYDILFILVSRNAPILYMQCFKSEGSHLIQRSYFVRYSSNNREFHSTGFWSATLIKVLC